MFLGFSGVGSVVRGIIVVLVALSVVASSALKMSGLNRHRIGWVFKKIH